MKAFLADLQQLQRNDDFEHKIKVAVTKNNDGDVSIEASMISNIDKGENDTNVYFYCYLYEYRSKRENEAELGKFKYLLLSDVAPTPQQK